MKTGPIIASAKTIKTQSLICILTTLCIHAATISSAQEDLLSMVDSSSNNKEYVTAAFKSTRVINGQSIEMLGKNVLDVRILHRFGLINEGINNLFGLDEASMRMGFDYGISKNIMIGVGRSTLGKELDGLIKYRAIQQAINGAPVSLIVLAGTTLTTQKFAEGAKYTETKHRMAWYSQLIIGRKFSERFSLQLSPTYVHRNLVPVTTDYNDTYALGIGSRLKISKRVACVADYHLIASGINKAFYKNPLSIGFDIETGGHVFQLHFSNSMGMNEKAFITGTTNNWSNGDIRFGFNLSRVFTIGGKKNKKSYPE
ncbi:MAG: DUF5777 family beta-barrel protein [Niabella sp.]